MLSVLQSKSFKRGRKKSTPLYSISRFRCLLHHLLHYRHWTSEGTSRPLLRRRTRGRAIATPHLFLRRDVGDSRDFLLCSCAVTMIVADDGRDARMRACVRWMRGAGPHVWMNRGTRARARIHVGERNQHNATAVGRGIMGPRLTEIRCGYRSINSSRKRAAQKPLFFLTTMTICWSQWEILQKFIPLVICPERPLWQCKRLQIAEMSGKNILSPPFF